MAAVNNKIDINILMHLNDHDIDLREFFTEEVYGDPKSRGQCFQILYEIGRHAHHYVERSQHSLNKHAFIVPQIQSAILSIEVDRFKLTSSIAKVVEIINHLKELVVAVRDHEMSLTL